MKDEIISIIREIIKIIPSDYPVRRFFESVERKVRRCHDDPDLFGLVRQVILPSYAGMGSLNDLSISRNGKVDVEATNELWMYLRRLRHACNQVIKDNICES